MFLQFCFTAACKSPLPGMAVPTTAPNTIRITIAFAGRVIMTYFTLGVIQVHASINIPEGHRRHCTCSQPCVPKSHCVVEFGAKELIVSHFQPGPELRLFPQSNAKLVCLEVAANHETPVYGGQSLSMCAAVDIGSGEHGGEITSNRVQRAIQACTHPCGCASQ